MIFESLLNTLGSASPPPAAPPIPGSYGNLTRLTQGWFLTAVADGIASDWAGLTDAMYEAYNNGGYAHGDGPYAVRISSILCIGTSVPQLPPTPVPPVQIKGSPPILVIGNINDPDTPYSWGQSLVSAIEGAVLRTWDGGGHTVFAEGVSDCIDNITLNYLVNLVTPPTATACPPIDPWANDE